MIKQIDLKFNLNVCYKDKSYYNYGERGITVCEPWMEFENFYNDMGSSGSSPGIGFGGGGSGGGGGGSGGLQNMFGKAAGTLQDMWKRLPTQGEQTSKQLHQKLNQNKFPQTAAEAAKKTKQGENPLDLFKKMGM